MEATAFQWSGGSRSSLLTTQTEYHRSILSTSEVTIGEPAIIPGSSSTITTIVPPANLTQVEAMPVLEEMGIRKVISLHPIQVTPKDHLRLSDRD